MKPTLLIATVLATGLLAACQPGSASSDAPTERANFETMNPKGQGLFVEYEEGPAPKAFALSADGSSCGYATKRSCKSGSVNCVKKVAIGFCKENGTGCKVLDLREP